MLKSHFYKKSRIQQLKSFCAVVECGVSLTKASEKLNISHSSISLHIKSLEYELGYDLLNRNGKKISLNSKGEEYYKEAKNALLAMDIAYNGKLNISRKSANLIILKNKLNNIVTAFKKSFLKVWNKMYIKITAKRVLVFLFVALSLVYFYLVQTNYFFDREILKLSEPFLRNLIIQGTYRIPPDEPCSFSGCQISIDTHELMIKLNNSYKDINMVEIFLGDCPIRIMRYNGNPQHDEIFNNTRETVCNTKEAHIATVKTFHDVVNMFENNKNFRIYSIHRNPEKCTGYDAFLENQIKYNNNFIGIKTRESDKMSNMKSWIFKHNKYYYLISSENVIHANIKPNNHERRLFFKKLTLQELMLYDNGIYWRLITKYNIKID